MRDACELVEGVVGGWCGTVECVVIVEQVQDVVRIVAVLLLLLLLLHDSHGVYKSHWVYVQ